MRERGERSPKEEDSSHDQGSHEKALLVLRSSKELDDHDSCAIDAMVEYCTNEQNLKDEGDGALNEFHDPVEAFLALRKVVHHPDVNGEVEGNCKARDSVQEPRNVPGVPSVRHQSTSFVAGIPANHQSTASTPHASSGGHPLHTAHDAGTSFGSAIYSD